MSPLLLPVPDLGCELVTVGRERCKGLLALGLLCPDLLHLPARRRKQLLLRRLRLPCLLDALLGLSDTGRPDRSLLREPRKLLADLGFLLARGFELLAGFGKLPSAFNPRLLKALGLAARRMDALLGLLCLNARLRQLLH